METWKTHTRRVVFEQPPWLTVEYHEVELPDGRIIPDWAWVKTPDYINVVVETESGEFLCFRQRKYGVPEPMLAVVGGYIEPGEVPLETARRELLEETGYVSENWVKLGEFLVDPNRGMATGHLYLARQAKKVTSINSDDLEEQQILFLNRQELEAALDRNDIKILAWATCAALALRHLGRE
jgi:ADP-ribose pyrophosphatase